MSGPKVRTMGKPRTSRIALGSAPASSVPVSAEELAAIATVAPQVAARVAKGKYQRKYATSREARLASMEGLQKAHRVLEEKRKERYYAQEFAPAAPALRGYVDWRRHVANRNDGYEYYHNHRLPPMGIPEPGRGGVWTPRTKPRAFIERYNPEYHTVYLVPKKRSGGYAHRKSNKPTAHYMDLVIERAIIAAANDKDGRARPPKTGGKVAEYKWARGYLKRKEKPIPAKTDANMGY